MVKRVISLFYKEIRGLHQAAYVLAIFALASQVLALFRDRLLANKFGAGSELDIYYAAFRIPDLLFVLFASVLSVYVLLPFVTKAKEESNMSASNILSSMLTLFLFVYFIVAIIAFFTAPYLIGYLFPGFSGEAQVITVSVMRILLIQPLLLGVSSLFGVVTQLNNYFVLYALSPVLYNIGIIFGALFLYPIFGLTGLAYGVLIGAFFHVVIQVPLIMKSKLCFGLTKNINTQVLIEIAKVAVPRAITLSLNQIMLLVIFGIATTMSVGSVAVLQFAYNLQSVPLAIIGMSYSIAAFPTLASLLVQKKQEEFNNYVITALRHVIFWSLPVVVLVVVLRAQLVRVLLGSGSFDWSDTRLTAAALAIFVISLVAQSFLLLIVRAFYAGGYTRLPLMVTLVGTCISTILAIIFYQFFIHLLPFQYFVANLFRLQNVTGAEVLMLPLGYSAGTIIQMFVMLLAANRTFKMSLGKIIKPAFVSLGASIVGGFFAYVALAFLVEGVNQERFMGIFLQGFVAGLMGIIGVIIGYRLLKSPEMHEIYMSYRSRILKPKIVAAETDLLQ